MGDIVSKYAFVPLLESILLLYDIIPFSNYFTYRNMLTGLIKLVVHRAVLNRRNLYKGKSNEYHVFFIVLGNDSTSVHDPQQQMASS